MLRQPSKRSTRKHPLECPACEGLGQTDACRTEVHARRAVDAHGAMHERLVTTKQGSGCLRCGGTGRLALAAVQEV